jgi:hypothetical protein
LSELAEPLGRRWAQTVYFAVHPGDLWAAAEAAVQRDPFLAPSPAIQLGVNEVCLGIFWGILKPEYIGRRWSPYGEEQDAQGAQRFIEDNPFVSTPAEHLLHLLAGKSKYVGVAWQRRLHQALPQLGAEARNAKRLVLGRRLEVVASEHGLSGWANPEWLSWLPLAEGRARVVEHRDGPLFRELVNTAIRTWVSDSQAPPHDLRRRLFQPNPTQDVVVLSVLGQLSTVVDALEAGFDILIGNADTEATAWEGTDRERVVDNPTWLVDWVPGVTYFAIPSQSRREATAAAVRSYPVQNVIPLEQETWQAELIRRMTLSDRGLGLEWHYTLPFLRLIARDVRYLGFGWEGFSSGHWLLALGVSGSSASQLLSGEDFLLRDRAEDPTLPTSWNSTRRRPEVHQPLPAWPSTMRLVHTSGARELRELVSRATDLYRDAGPDLGQILGVEDFNENDDRTILVMFAFASRIVEALEEGADVLVLG